MFRASTLTTLHHYFFLYKTRPGLLRPTGTTPQGSPSLPAPAPAQTSTWPLHRRHRKQLPRASIATACSLVFHVAPDYRASRNSRTDLAAQAKISRELGHRAPARRRRIQHRVCLHHDQHARKLFGGGHKGKKPEHLEVGDGPPTSGALESSIRQRDHKPGEARCLRACTNQCSPSRTEGGGHAVGKTSKKMTSTKVV